MQKFVVALNSVGSQIIALLLIAFGGGFILLFKHSGVDIRPGEDIIVAGIAILTAQATASKTHTTDGQPSSTNQVTETPSVPPFPSPTTQQK